MLYVKCMRCSGLPRILGRLEEAGGGQSVMKITQCIGLTCIYGQLEEGVGSVCHENDLVLWSSGDPCSLTSCFASEKVFSYYIPKT